MTVDVAIIGAGVSGLAVAHDLKRRGRRVLVLDRRACIGGSAVSEEFGGFLMEHGPSAINATASEVAALSRDLGLDASRCDLGDGVRHRYLARGGRLHALPLGPVGLLLSPYLSFSGRLRLMAEIAVPPRRDGADETVAGFFDRRFGREFSEFVVDPLVGGLFAGRASEMSMRSAFPRLVEMERRFGAVSRAVLARRWQGGRMPGRRLFSWQGGIGSLAKALATTLADMIRTGVAVRRIRRTAAGFRIEAGDAGTLEAVSVVLAAQPHAAAQILERIDDRLTRAIAGISAPPLAVVFLGYRRDQVEHPLDGVGYLTPESEGRLLTGAQFNSTMFPGRAPDGHVAVTGYLGGARAPDLARHPAEELVDLARTEFAELIGARGRPVVARVRQWALGLPQYGPGHAERVTRVVEETEGTAGLFVTGNYLRGPSIASCLAVAHETAAKVERFLQETGTARIAGRRQIGAARTYGHWRAEGGAR